MTSFVIATGPGALPVGLGLLLCRSGFFGCTCQGSLMGVALCGGVGKSW